VIRQAARVVLLDDRHRVLLFRGFDPADPDRPGGSRQEAASTPANRSKKLLFASWLRRPTFFVQRTAIRNWSRDQRAAVA